MKKDTSLPDAAIPGTPTSPRKIRYNGVTDTVAGWAERAGKDPSTLHHRIFSANWPVSSALSTRSIGSCTIRGRVALRILDAVGAHGATVLEAIEKLLRERAIDSVLMNVAGAGQKWVSKSITADEFATIIVEASLALKDSVEKPGHSF